MSKTSAGKPAPHTEVEVATIGPCDVNHLHGQAAYDAKTVFGPWAYLCEECFEHVGTGLGLGKGQRLKLRAPK